VIVLRDLPILECLIRHWDRNTWMSMGRVESMISRKRYERGLFPDVAIP
jgi:hypothetical protein